MKPARIFKSLRRFKRDEDGAALVEFGILLPTMLLFFAMAIEGSRFFWSYQSVIAGVRDASRYVGRSAPSDICSNSGSLQGYDFVVWDIVRKTSSGQAMFPNSLEVVSANATLDCVMGSFRMDETPIATISVKLRMTFPFADVFGLFGVDMSPITTTVTDSTRVFGA